MKKLAKATVIKAFEKLGFEFNFSFNVERDYDSYFFLGSYVGQNMDLHIPKDRFGNIELLDARWEEDGGVHIDSYYGWPRNIKELADIINRIKHTYSTLCGTNFKD